MRLSYEVPRMKAVVQKCSGQLRGYVANTASKFFSSLDHLQVDHTMPQRANRSTKTVGVYPAARNIAALTRDYRGLYPGCDQNFWVLGRGTC